MLLAHRHRLARTALVVTLSLVLPAQDLLARGGGGGGARGGAGGGAGARGGGGAGFGGGAGGGAGRGGAAGGGARPANPGAGHAGGAGGAGGNRGAGGGAGREGGIGERNVEGGAGNRAGIGGAGTRGGENAGIGNRENTGSGNRSNNNVNRANINNGNFNAGNTVNVNRNGNTYNHYGNNYGHNGYNNYWHNGYWPGYHPYGYGYGWGAAATAGLVGWGLGSMAASSGYGGGYSNPYYASSASAGTNYDYSTPIPQDTAANQNPDAPPTPEQAKALKSFDVAREEFKAGKYEAALTKIDETLKLLPNDAALHEFRGLVLFALARYQEAASTIYAVLSAGPGWNWTTLSGMYASIDDYTKQLRALEGYSKQHPESPDAAFLLSYHYLTCGYTDQAAKQLQIVIKLLPDDRLAPQLLQMVNGNSATPQPPASAAPAADGEASSAAPATVRPTIDRAKLVGTWKASPGKGVAIELTLKGDTSFTWKVTQSGKPNVIEGEYSVENDQLTLTQKSNGETMVGRVSLADNGGFNFKLMETGPGDPGLNFTK